MLAWAAQPRGVGGHCPPTFEAKGVQGYNEDDVQFSV